VKSDRLIDRPDAVSDVDARVPEEMEDGLRGVSRRFQKIPESHNTMTSMSEWGHSSPRPYPPSASIAIVSIIPAGRQSHADRIASSVTDVRSLHVRNPPAPLRCEAAISAFRVPRNDFSDWGSVCMDYSEAGGGYDISNIPNEVRRFNGTAEIPYAIDYEFNDLQHAHAVNSKQKLFIGGNSFLGTTIATLPVLLAPIKSDGAYVAFTGGIVNRRPHGNQEAREAPRVSHAAFFRRPPCPPAASHKETCEREGADRASGRQ